MSVYNTLFSFFCKKIFYAETIDQTIHKKTKWKTIHKN